MPGVRLDPVLDDDPVLPAVAEVVEVVEGGGACSSYGIGERGLGGGADVVAVVGVRQAPTGLAYRELPEVVVLPGHGGLEHQVQPVEPHGLRDLDPAQDGWLYILERHA